MKLISKEKLKATKDNLLKNDCPSQCDKTHCDVCQFTDNKKVVTVINPSPEVYGKEMCYQVESINSKERVEVLRKNYILAQTIGFETQYDQGRLPSLSFNPKEEN